MNAIASIVMSCNARIIPIDPASKQPHLKDWPDRGTDNLEVLETWWAKWPKALIGVTTGEASEFWALDVDKKNGGADSLARLVAIHGQLPDTVRYRTPGGYRYCFRWPRGVTLKSRTSDIAAGLDVRGGRADGSSTGQIIVPPSVRADGGKYEWDGREGLYDPAEAPAWLLFLAIFSRRERAALASIGITGPETFAGLPVTTWHAEGRARLKPAKDRPARPGGALLTPAEAADLERYVRGAVTKECEALAAAVEGERQSKIGSAALAIHSLMMGAELEGMDSSDLETWAFDQWLEARDSLSDGAHTAEDPIERWERCRGDADPRDLEHVLRIEFDDISDCPARLAWQAEWQRRQEARKTAPTGLIMHRGDSFDPEAIDWFWRHRIAAGKLHLTAGYGDAGKTTVLLGIAALFSRGGPWPDGTGNAPRGSVIYFSTEDDRKDTLLPRFMAAGGDRSKIHFVTGVHRDDGKGQRGFKYGEDLEKLERAIDQIGDVREVTLDPLNAYFGGTNSWHNSDVRGVLEPLAEMAARKRVAIFGNTHFSKGSAATANMKVLDSVGIVNLARLVYVVSKDPDDESGSQRLFIPSKYNIAPGLKGLRFHIEERTLDAAKGVTGTLAVWDADDVTATADETLAKLTTTRKGPSALDEAVAWLKTFLADGPKPANDVKDEGVNGAMHSWATLKRAADRLGVVSTKAGLDEGWKWRLPAICPEFEDISNDPAVLAWDAAWRARKASKTS
jgi:putative DNA primase/helicase